MYFDNICLTICLKRVENNCLTFTTLRANSADDKVVIIFLFSPENRLLNFIQIVPWRDNLHEMSKPVFRGKIKELPYSTYLPHMLLEEHSQAIP